LDQILYHRLVSSRGNVALKFTPILPFFFQVRPSDKS
jgi:hypothetical protein